MTVRFDPTTTCLHLRCKQMFYEVIDEDTEFEEPSPASDTAAFWCQQTQTGRGPDEKPVNRSECCPGRSCFENARSLT